MQLLQRLGGSLAKGCTYNPDMVAKFSTMLDFVYAEIKHCGWPNNALSKYMFNAYTWQ